MTVNHHDWYHPIAQQHHLAAAVVVVVAVVAVVVPTAAAAAAAVEKRRDLYWNVHQTLHAQKLQWYGPIRVVWRG